jgi:hypothetical protein
VGSAEASVEAHSPEGIRTFAGRRLALYILMGAAAVGGVLFFAFYHKEVEQPATVEPVLEIQEKVAVADDV